MAKEKTIFICQSCGNESPKWQGKCPSCQAWNTLVEEIKTKDTSKQTQRSFEENISDQYAIPIQDIETHKTQRIVTPDLELNNVLGGGIVSGSVVLVSGEPGIGKSTLFLQLALSLQNMRVLYISGEESLQQIKLRANRLNIKHNELLVYTNTNTTAIYNEIKKVQPQLVIVDSIQTLESSYIESAPGSVSQVRECTAEIVRIAKKNRIPIFIIGHITKDGAVAGPKVLEHMVDTVLYFEGDQHYTYRILRTTKNRFGNASELGIYEMREDGLKGIQNPSEILISQRDENLSGIAIAATLEGARPLLIETQALVTQAVYGTPQRTISGFDSKRTQLLLAVLEKKGGFHFGVKDVFINLAGGIRIEDPAIDLAIISALLSSYEERPIADKICFAGEVGLSGEVRAVHRVEQRISEAEKLGFEKIYVSSYNKISLQNKNIEIVSLSNIEQLYHLLF
ncbi:MAG: DNA repair protein RadA [Chitinophagaceae bacterium]